MLRRVLATFGLATAFLLSAQADPPKDTPPIKTNPSELLKKQKGTSNEYKELEKALINLANYYKSSDNPEDQKKYRVLKRVLEEASGGKNEESVRARFGKLDDLMERLAKSDNPNSFDLKDALDKNQDLVNKLDKLFELLQRDDIDDRKEEIARTTKLLEDLKKLIREQKIARARTEAGKTDKNRLSREQEGLAKKTDNLSRELGGEKPAKGDAKGSDSKGGDSKGGDPKGGDSKDPKGGNSKDGDPKGKNSQGGDSKGGDPKNSDPKGSDSKGGDSKGGDSKGGDSKGGDSKGGDSKGGDSKGGDSKGGDSQGGNQSQQPQKNDGNNIGQKQVQEAVPYQKKAAEDIAKNDREQAAKNQDKAIEKLEEAQRELEKRLHQLRKEEMLALLAKLEEHCDWMLREQIKVKEATKSIDQSIQATADKKPDSRDIRLAKEQAEKEGAIVKRADIVLRLLETEGSAVAFPQVFEEVRKDMINVQKRLDNVRVESDTQAIEQEIIDALQEMIAALQKAKQDAKNSQPQSGGGGGGGGGPKQQPLIDQLAELKMIRSLQLRLNTRTIEYSKRYTGEQADDKQIRDELRELAERQEKIYGMTKNIGQGNNQ